MSRSIPKPVQMTDMKAFLSNHQLPDPSRKWVESRTTDEFCTIEHRLINTSILSHRVLGGFVYQTNNPKFKGRVVFFIEKTEKRTDVEDADDYTHITSYYYNGPGMLQYAWMHGECERRLFETNEGETFRYRNMKRRRLQMSEIKNILNDSDLWRSTL